MKIPATPYELGNDKEEELLPFWRIYVENTYKAKWEKKKTLTLIKRGGDFFIGERCGKYEVLYDYESCAKALNMPPEAFRDALKVSGDEVLKRYAEAIKGPFDQVIKDGDGYTILHLASPTEQFIDDVYAGKVFDPATGYKLSLRQARARLPAAGFLQEMLGAAFSRVIPQSEHYLQAKSSRRLGYYRGLVVKICGDHDPALRKHHNTWGVIVKILDAYHYLVVKEWTGEKLIIRDTDVKAIIGDGIHDFIGIGAERHKKEVAPLIRKALAGKIPVAESWEFHWPRPPLRQALVAAYVDFDPDFETSPKDVVIKALRASEKWLAEVERKRKKYEPEDYKRVHGTAVLWVKLYQLLMKRLERIEKGERKVVAHTRDKECLNFVAFRLSHAGIPFIWEDSRIMVCPEDFNDALIAIH